MAGCSGYFIRHCYRKEVWRTGKNFLNPALTGRGVFILCLSGIHGREIRLVAVDALHGLLLWAWRKMVVWTLFMRLITADAIVLWL